jgi:flagellar hook-basal body complex protein FliE
VGATESIAQSHSHFANRIEADVERPLREFGANNRDMQAMSNIQGNLTALAKDIDSAQKKTGKLRDKGSKAKASAVADAVQETEKAELQWDSQAPYVYEQLQAIDETRLNHLRDVLTQFQTHEVDQVERSRTTAEETLNAMLNIETADEIQTYALRIRSGEGPKPSRQLSNTGAQSRSLAPPTGAPGSPTPADDNRSQKSGSGA